MPQEVDELFDNLRELKSEGLTVLFISHKLDEVLKVADAITVIRRGTTVARSTRAGRRRAARRADGRLRAALAVDRGVDGHATPSADDRGHRRSPTRRAAARCSTTSTLTIHAGEVARHRRRRGQRPGRARRGHHGHARAHARPRPARRRRHLRLAASREIREAGVGYIPEDRHRHGLLLEAPLWENRILGHQTEAPNVRRASSSTPRGAKADTERIVEEYDVRTPSINVTPGSLSGGNQQKLIIGREMSHNPKVLVAAHPTRGVDVGAQASIWDHIRRRPPQRPGRPARSRPTSRS